MTVSNVYTVVKDNKQLTIPATQKNYYLSHGYNVLAADGKVQERAIPQDVAALQLSFKENSEKIEKLTKENSKLKEDIKKLKAKVKATKEDESSKVENK